MDLSVFERGLEAFASIAPTSFPLHHVQVFIYVAQHEGCTYKEIEDELSLTNSSVSRTINALGGTHRKGYEGHDLLLVQNDIEEGRRYTVWLTKKGKSIMRQLDKIK